MKGCLTFIGAVVVAIIGLTLVYVGLGSMTHGPAAASEPAAPPAARKPAVSAPVQHHRHRRHRHHPAAVNPSTDPRAADPTFHLCHIDRWGEDEIGMVHVYGTAINNTDHELSYAQLTLRLLDRNGDQVGTVLANTTNLPAGACWRFDAMGSGAGAFRLAMGDETGY